jgi:bifunctional DNase/RNase
MLVQMELSRIVISDNRIHQIIVLQEVEGERKLPITIGSYEAEAIDRRLKGVTPSRPLTHELLASVIEELGGTLERIEITDIQGGTFYGKLCIRQSNELIEVDSRPSDAIALGIATGVPIFVADHVLQDEVD